MDNAKILGDRIITYQASKVSAEYKNQDIWKFSVFGESGLYSIKYSQINIKMVLLLLT